MYFWTGISDEAGEGLATQIKAHMALGWRHIELRKVNGRGILALSDKDFRSVLRALQEANLKVSCLGSPIGDWSHSIRDSALPDANLLRRAVKRANQLADALGMLPFVRVMSYPNDKDDPMPEELWRQRAIDRMYGLLKIVEDTGVVLAHENCSGWGGISAENNDILLREVDHEQFGVLFDTGNPPTYGKNTWEWFQTVRGRIVYVHIKDARKEDGTDVYTYPGEGAGCVGQVLASLLDIGYEGGISIEPHMQAVIHTGQKAADPRALYDNYVEYGHRLIQLVEDITRNTA